MKRLKSVDIPFQEINIDPEHGDAIIRAIGEYIGKHSGESISLQKIIEQTGLPGDEVKDVFFALLTLRYLKPTFMPRHILCESAIGSQKKSVEDIRNKFEAGGYPEICARCHEEIAEFDELEIEIIFWKGRGDFDV
ncbi:hypothetical protein VU12_10595 [Desulfobulbus sp. US4]|nr:hypothetical protein [Desulfobulbus sp. US4]